MIFDSFFTLAVIQYRSSCLPPPHRVFGGVHGPLYHSVLGWTYRANAKDDAGGTCPAHFLNSSNSEGAEGDEDGGLVSTSSPSLVSLSSALKTASTSPPRCWTSSSTALTRSASHAPFLETSRALELLTLATSYLNWLRTNGMGDTYSTFRDDFGYEAKDGEDRPATHQDAMSTIRHAYELTA